MSDEQRADWHGRFVWYDLMTADAAGSVAFYTSALPWQTVAMPMPEGDYTMWTLTGGQDGSIGGVGPLPGEGVPPHWMSHVAVTDVDATAAAAEGLGGAIHVPPTDIPGIGRYAGIGDPQGGAIGIYTSAATPPGPIAEPKIGAFSWHELGTSDLGAALSFYGELFGWQKMETHDMGEMGIYQIYGQGGVPYGGMFKRPPEMPVTMWIYYVRVADLDATLEAVKAGGGQVANGPMDVPGGDRVAQCVDPQGAMFALHQHNG